MCTVLLPPGDNPIAVNKYIIITSSVIIHKWLGIKTMRLFSSLAQQSKAGVGSLTVKVSKLQLRHTALPAELLRTSDHLVAEAAIYTTNTRDVHP
jgi:hypothetical protein